MRFTAFISTLLSALTVLATNEPYAGYKAEILTGDAPIRHVSAIVQVPQIWTKRCFEEPFGFIAVAIGDYRTCVSGGLPIGFEAGLKLACTSNGHSFTAYTKSYAHNRENYYPELEFEVGDEVKIELDINSGGGVYARIFNIRQSYPLWKSVGSISGIGNICLATALWALKAVYKSGSDELLPLPEFHAITFTDLLVLDDLSVNVGYEVPEDSESPDRLFMKTGSGYVLAFPYPIVGHKQSFRIFPN